MMKLIKVIQELKGNPTKFTEVLENSVRLGAGKGFEANIVDLLIKKGVVDLTDQLERKNFENQKQSLELERLVGKLETKKARILWHKNWRQAVKQNLPELVNFINESNYVIRQPDGNKRPPDLLIVETVNGKRIAVKISVKTGGSPQPKLNDRPLGQDEIVIFHQNGEKNIEGRTTFVLGSDCMPLQDISMIKKYYEDLKEWNKKWRQENPLREEAIIVPNPRPRVDLTKYGHDWFGKKINGLDIQEREQRVIDYLQKL